MTIVESAVADAPGRLWLYVDPQTPELSALDPDWLRAGPDHEKASKVHRRSVETTTVSALIDRFGMPDYVKMDVEGSETLVLRGLHVPIRALSFEFHVQDVNDLRERLRLIDALGRYQYNYMRAASYTLALPEWADPETIVSSILASDGSLPDWGDIVARRVMSAAYPSLSDE